MYLLDTVALVRHFTGLGKIGHRAATLLEGIEQGRDSLLISIVSLMEVLYLSEKRRISIDLGSTLDRIRASECYAVVDLNTEILRAAETIEFRELHDRLILATAKWLDVPVLSSDQEFETVDGIEVIWN